MKIIKAILVIIIAFLASAVSTYYLMMLDSNQTAKLLFLSGSSILILQGIVTLSWMLYAWNDPDSKEKQGAPKQYEKPYYTFTALVPMRNESKVVHDTLMAINAIDYPNNLKEVIVVIRHDDKDTIETAQKTINAIANENISLHILWESYPINKPLSLNMGIGRSAKDVIAIFDAEDQPSPDIYKIVNTTLIREKVDVVQSGVQLMNYNSHWFSSHNILEYFLWFKSGMHFFTDIGNVSILGGNTVFFKKVYLDLIGGWDEEALTEDADVGIRLSLAGAKTKVIYDERHVTEEETPSTISEFIKQRTRWNHGFLQIITKGDWLMLPELRQKIISLYVLTAPFYPVLMMAYLPIALYINANYPVGVFLTMYSYIPFYILFLIVSMQVVALYEFTRIYNQKFYWYLPLKMVLTFLPYVSMLCLAAARSGIRFIFNKTTWEKTTHLNLHRSPIYAKNN